ncbi:MAG: tetratricopeptide repeat protein [Candidatus Riflebacteria bacterium]|nr:tetratricopeptide repeat protein [Candidatus Riflebacteria bacterium]
MVTKQTEEHFERGIRYFRGGFFASALQEFRHVERIDPRYPNIAYMVEVARKKNEEVNGQLISFMEDNFDAEIRTLSESIKIPESSSLVRDIGRMLQQERVTDALTKLEDIAIHIPESKPLLLLTATVYRRAGRLDDSEKTLLRAKVLYPKDTDVLNAIGNIYLSRSQFPEAREHFEMVLNITPDDRNARNNLAAFFMQTWRLDEAYRRFNALAKEFPDWTVVRRNLANVALRRDELDREIDKMRHEFELHPTYLDIGLTLGKTLLFRGFFSESRRRLELVIEKNPNILAAYFYLGELSEIEGDIPRAVEAYSELIRRKKHDDNPEFRAFLNLWNQGYQEEALFDLKKLAVLDLDTAAGHIALGMRYFDDALWNQALRHFQEAAEAAPYPDAYYWMGLTRLQLGKKKAAGEDFKKAIELNSRFADAHYQLGMLLRTKTPKKARNHLQTAITLGLRPQFAALARDFIGETGDK